MLCLTEERFRFETEIETSFVDQDVRRVDLYSESSSSVFVFLVVKSQVEFEIVLVGEN